MTGPLRPTYSEGQILGAADLNAQLTYERLTGVLHERTEHTWGIAQGLALIAVSSPDVTGAFDVSISPGRAVDQLGRSIVVTSTIALDPHTFSQQITASGNPDDLYPVFVQAIEIPQKGSQQPGKCAVNLTTRIEEAVQVEFGGIGSELSVLDQPVATVDQGFGTATGTNKVLVGWVKFDTDHFTGVATEASGTKLRYIGVVASDVAAGGGTLTLHTRQSGKRFTVELAETANGATLKFGKQDGTDPVVSVLEVNEKGDITYAGKLLPPPVAAVSAESGVISDGLIVPLPAGVSATAKLHIQLTPFMQAPRDLILGSATGTSAAIPLVLECYAEPDSRVVHCRIRWCYAATATTDYIDLPGQCSYLIVASGG